MKTCNVPGCDQPCYKQYSSCHEHMKARWRENAQKHRTPDVKPRENRKSTACPLCGRDRDQAAIWAARGVTCDGCQVKPAAPRQPATKVADRGGILIAYPCYSGHCEIQYLRAVLSHTEPMPKSEGDLRLLMEQRVKEGVLIARKVAW